jgi:FkbM family methyltransferase
MKAPISNIKSVFKRIGLYERLKESWLYDFYWNIADRRYVMQRNREVEFYRELLNGFHSGDLIFDIGANHGTKVDIFLRLGAEVVAIEPDEFNQGVLKRRFLDWRIKPKSVTIVGKAVGEDVATKTMWIDAPGSAKNTLNPKWVETLRADEERFGERLNFAKTRQVQTTTLEHLISEYGEPFFVKIDVEGFEPQVLRGLKRPVTYLSFEVNLPEFQTEGLECLELLEKLSEHGSFNYTLDCQQGMMLKQWVEFQEMIKIFNACKEPCVEVFWSRPNQVDLTDHRKN